ncbi:alpha/beta fold hydrolase [Gordonia sp. HNM0687]|uniref:Alpha/beta fold hydrolase n=1 Tax=Gordonia mangrovi TaxID=2665643 RepID=A0A6L7GPP1_9ACTN|nr:alpha/beta fold hydrolase [Gordonia mangrovi]MXP21850.1 alpha/beta fold hydrolase [Gordonia mangrovi]UVF76220.1 alpha/beta fold hydrolase [Gordonia mangrovi]
MTAPARIDVDLGHLRLHALTWGDPAAPLAICLHGFPDSAWTWRHLGPTLVAAGYRVVAPFTRGYAPSDVPADGDYHVAALAYDALALHRALDGDDRAVLIGHDWGAMTVHAIATRTDHPFRHLIALAVPPIAAVRDLSIRSRVRLLPSQVAKSWYIVVNQLPVLPERTLDRLIPLLWRRWGPTPATEDVDNALATIPTMAHRCAILNYYRAPVRSRVNERYADDSTAWLRRPLTPITYLHGDADRCLHPGFVDGLPEVLPAGSTVVRVASAGHFLQLDQPEVVGRHIVAALDATGFPRHPGRDSGGDG